MQIVSIVFVLFVACIFGLLLINDRCVRKEHLKLAISKGILLFGSYIFVFYADWRFALVLLGISISTYISTKSVKLYKIGIIIAIICLGYFKYTNFFAESFCRIVGYDYTAINLILPLGISFYTFSAISYITDVSRGKIEAKSFMDVALYLAYFPKLTSGPIQKSSAFFEQIEHKKSIGYNSFSDGIQIFMFGLLKKIVLADRLSVFVNQVYATPMVFGSFTVFLATVAYSLQIYFDFSGYSDMAIGVSKLIGIDLPRNFNLPYLSHNVTELWKRWHITLSAWLQEYLYISMGGNRKGKAKTYINLIVTMLLGGIWHGANWTYIIWGLLHGIALAMHKAWMSIIGSDKKMHSKLANVICVVITFLFTNFCWIFFRAESLDHSIEIIRRICSFESGVEQPYFWFFIGAIVLTVTSAVSTVKSYNKPRNIKKTNVSLVDGYYPIVDLTTIKGMTIFFVFCGLIICLAYTGGSAFIYGKY